MFHQIQSVYRTYSKYSFDTVLPHYSCSKSSFDTVLTPDCDPQPCASGGRCLRRFGDLRKMTPGFFEHVYCQFSHFLSI